MKPLQNYIEEEIKEFDNKFGMEEFDNCRGGFFLKNDHIFPEMKQFLSQSLHRIAEITAEEIVPKKKETNWNKLEDNQSDQDNRNIGYNSALSDLQTKIKEFGI